jgi:hypothetical protein
VQRLIVYMFAHLMLCTSNKERFPFLDQLIGWADVITRLLNQFTETVQLWKTWDIITVIQKHQIIKDNLWYMFQLGLRVRI